MLTPELQNESVKSSNKELEKNKYSTALIKKMLTLTFH
jgi:hypothetical protein